MLDRLFKKNKEIEDKKLQQIRSANLQDLIFNLPEGSTRTENGKWLHVTDDDNVRRVMVTSNEDPDKTSGSHKTVQISYDSKGLYSCYLQSGFGMDATYLRTTLFSEVYSSKDKVEMTEVCKQYVTRSILSIDKHFEKEGEFTM